MKPALPDNIANGQFLIVGSGETYQSKIVSGTELYSTMMEWIYGTAWEVDTNKDHREAYWNELCDPDQWNQDNDYGAVKWSRDVGETDRIEILRITDAIESNRAEWERKGMERAAEIAKTSNLASCSVNSLRFQIGNVILNAAKEL